MARLVLALVAALLSANLASASTPVAVSGDFQVIGAAPTGFRFVDDACFIDLDASFAFIGDLDGAFTAHFVIAHHGPCADAAPENFRATGTYAGTVTLEGTARSGTFTFTFDGRIDAAGNAAGRLVVLGAAGGLAGLHGFIDLSGQAGVGGTYAGELHVDPAD